MQSHLQSADDLLLFRPSKSQMITNYRRLLDRFYLILGLRINYSKSALCILGKGEEWVRKASSKLHCEIVELPRKMTTWEPILNKIVSKLASWKAKLLSRVGRLTLIKVVLNNLPTYYSGIFKLPNQVAKIIQLQRNFFWSGDGKS